jgi:protein ImuB
VLDATSARARVVGGMRRGGVLTLAPDATLHERMPRVRTKTVHGVAAALLQFTPLVVIAEENGSGRRNC